MIETKPLTINTDQNVVRHYSPLVLQWDKAIVVRRNSVKQIPEDQDLIKQARQSMEQRQIVDYPIAERILDKLLYYYFHFLVSSERESKSHYYNAFFLLSSALTKMGCSPGHYRDIKSIAMDKKKRVESVLESLKSLRKDESSLLSFRDISRQYEQFKADHTVYGENILSILGEMLKREAVQFY